MVSSGGGKVDVGKRAGGTCIVLFLVFCGFDCI